MRTGAIDCGTNSIRLLIADTREEQGRTVLDDVVREMRVVRLGQGVDATGWLAEAALERTFAATDEYARLLAEHGVEQLRFVATSATRDAGNRDVFLAGIRERLGVTPRSSAATRRPSCPSAAPRPPWAARIRRTGSW